MKADHVEKFNGFPSSTHVDDRFTPFIKELIAQNSSGCSFKTEGAKV